MARSQGVRIDSELEDVVDDLQDRGLADDTSDAIRRLAHAGMQDYGYQNGTHYQTPSHQASGLQTAAGEFARAFAWVGIAWLALTLMFPIEIRLGAVFAFAAALGCSGLYVVLENHEDHVKTIVKRVFRRGDNA